jgi:hypothetical protein
MPWAHEIGGSNPSAPTIFEESGLKILVLYMGFNTVQVSDNMTEEEAIRNFAPAGMNGILRDTWSEIKLAMNQRVEEKRPEKGIIDVWDEKPLELSRGV